MDNKKEKGKTAAKGCGIFVLAIVVIVILVGVFSEEEVLTPDQEWQKTIDHCFSAWDGSHIELERIIKNGVKDPGSYEHIQTKHILDDSLTMSVMMSFRSKNGFGGMVVTNVIAKTSVKDCNVIDYRVE